MQKIPLELAQPEMVLGKAVTRENGMVLVAAGTALTASLISKLENMGVEEVVVQGELQLGDGCSPEDLAKKQERLDFLFRNFTDDEYMQQMKKIISDYHTRRCAIAAAQAAKTEGQ